MFGIDKDTFFVALRLFKTLTVLLKTFEITL